MPEYLRPRSNSQVRSGRFGAVVAGPRDVTSNGYRYSLRDGSWHYRNPAPYGVDSRGYPQFAPPPPASRIPTSAGGHGSRAPVTPMPSALRRRSASTGTRPPAVRHDSGSGASSHAESLRRHHPRRDQGSPASTTFASHPPLSQAGSRSRAVVAGMANGAPAVAVPAAAVGAMATANSSPSASTASASAASGMVMGGGGDSAHLESDAAARELDMMFDAVDQMKAFMRIMTRGGASSAAITPPTATIELMSPRGSMIQATARISRNGSMIKIKAVMTQPTGDRIEHYCAPIPIGKDT